MNVLVRVRLPQVSLALLVVLLAPGVLDAQPPELWGTLELRGEAAAIRRAAQLGDASGRPTSTVLLDFVRRYANTDMRAAADRLEQFLTESGEAPEAAPQTRVPLPLPEFWRQHVFSGSLPPIAALLRNRGALLTYHGFMALDDETLSDMAGRPRLLQAIVDSDTASAALATFGPSLRLSAGALEMPGGESAVSIWEHLVGHPAGAVDSFVMALFETDRGRLAWFYDTVHALPPAKQRFVLAEGLPLDERLAAVEVIYQRFSAVDPGWHIPTRPFHRPAFDAALALTALDVTENNRVGPDWWRDVFNQLGSPGAYDAGASDSARGGSADGRWFFEWVFGNPEQSRRRFATVRFAQRVFAASSAEQAAEVHAALQGVLNMPVLLTTLERMGIRDPAMLSVVTASAQALTLSGGQNAALRVLAKWQAAVGLLEQAQRHMGLPASRVSTLLRALVAVTPADAESGTGFVATWLDEALVPAVIANDAGGPPRRLLLSPALEDVFLERATTRRGSRQRVFSWEGLPYVVTRSEAALASASAIRRARPGPRLQDLLELHRLARELDDIPPGTDIGPALVRRLEALGPVVALLQERAPDGAAEFNRLIDTIAETGGDRLPRHRRVLSATVDLLTDAVVPPLLYALAVSPTAEPILYPEVWTRHTLVQPSGVFFGSRRPWREVAWQSPTDYGLGGGTRLVGSFLAVDVALADARLMRVTTDVLPVPGIIDHALRRGLTEALVFDSGEVRSPTVLPQLAEGRRMVAAWQAAPPGRSELSARLREAAVDEWRANAIAWEVDTRGPQALENLTMAELLWLGSPAGESRVGSRLQSGSARGVDGCLCRLEAGRISHERLRGRRLGVQAFRPLDLMLRLAELLEQIDIDEAVVFDLLPVAFQDWLDHSQPAWPDDWEAFTMFPRTLNQQRLEAYLLHLIASGLLSPPAEEPAR